MTSRVSSFKIALEDMRHRSWMIALSFLGNFLALPVLFLLFNRTPTSSMARISGGDDYLTRRVLQGCTEFFPQVGVWSEGLVLFAGALIVALGQFRYLYSRKMSDLYHALPVKRRKMFLITWLNGILVWLIPMLLSVLLTLIFLFSSLASVHQTAAFGAIIAQAGQSVLLYLIAYLTVYHLTLVCVMFSGNLLNALCSTVLTGTLFSIGYGVFYMLCSTFFDTFIRCSISLDQIAWLSPLVSPVLLLAGGTLGDLPLFFLCMVLCVLFLNFLAAWFLYCKRPSELAEHGIENRPVQFLLRTVSAFCGSLLGALLFIIIVVDNNAYGWHLFGAVLAGVLTYGVLDIIFRMNFRSFFAHKYQMLATILCSYLLLLSFSFDWWHFDQRIPAAQSMESICIPIVDFNDQATTYRNIGSDRFLAIGDQGDENTLERRMITDLLTAFISDNISSDTQESYDYISGTDVQIRLKNGRLFERHYRFSTKQAMQVKALIESDAYRLAFYPVSSNQMGMPSRLCIESSFNALLPDTTDASVIASITEAYYADFAEHYSAEELNNGIYLLDFSVVFPENPNTTYRLRVKDTYTKTLQAVRENFPQMLLTAADMAKDKNLSLYVQPLSGDLSSVTKELLYSYFGMAGYPDYDSYLESLSGKEISNAVDTEVTDSAYYRPYADACLALYNNTTDSDFLKELLPYLHIGNRRENAFVSPDNRYVYLGTLINRDGQSVTCYVKSGELPEKYILNFLDRWKSPQQ